MDLNKLKTFYYVALEGSYQKASSYLGIKSSYISKQLSSLEDTYKIKLFKRAHRSLILTEEGKEFFKAVQIVMQQVEKIEEFSDRTFQDENDVIRIVTTTGFTHLWVVREIRKFIDLHPNYQLRILTTDEKIDISQHYADVAISPMIEPNPDIIRKRLLTVSTKLYASQSYLEQFGVPEKPEDLDNHRLIGFYHNLIGHRGNADWHLSLGVKSRKPRDAFFVVNSAVAIHQAVVSGIGIAPIIKDIFGYENFDLVNVLPDQSVRGDIYFATHIEKMNLKKVSVLENFFSELSEPNEED